MHVVIVGGGRTGSHLAGLLLAGGHRVRVVEHREETVAKLLLELPGDVVVAGDGGDPKVLVAAGIRAAQVAAVVTGADEDNLVVATMARSEFAVPRVIARVNNPRNAWLFTPAMGVDVALAQADLMAKLIAEEMSLGDMTILVKLRRGEVSLAEERIEEGAPAAGKAIRVLAIPAGCTIAAIVRGKNVLAPRGDTVLLPDDEVIAVVRTAQAAELARLLRRA
jgi:trk system potassium uptake protein TrkA